MFAALSRRPLCATVSRIQRLTLLGQILHLQHTRLGADKLFTRVGGVVPPLVVLLVDLHRVATVSALDCVGGRVAVSGLFRSHGVLSIATILIVSMARYMHDGICLYVNISQPQELFVLIYGSNGALFQPSPTRHPANAHCAVIAMLTYISATRWH